MSRAARLVLLTGASSGIGLETARRLAADGDRVLGLARDASRLAALETELGGSPRFVPLEADVADAVSMERAVSTVLERHGIPDVVIANAGVGLDARFVETDDDALRRVFEINVFGLVRTVRPFVGGMVDRGSGRIVLVSSIVGKRGTPHYAAYSASKFALHGLADALRPELAGSGVTVGLVCPASTGTEFQQRLARRGPSQRRVRPRVQSAAHVAGVVARMSRSTRIEQLTTFESRLLVWADAIAPGLVDRFLARALARSGESAD